MSVSSVTNNPLLSALSTQHPASEAGEATRNGRDVRNDSDADDGSAPASAAANAPKTPAPTVNASGQVIGQHINVQA